MVNETTIQNKMGNPQNSLPTDSNGPQCQFFVIRKKRLCRMTVRPGRQYCGEHEPQPKVEDGQVDTRITCPNDPKHTCYASKLEKHLAVCNARQGELPPYIVPNINAPAEIDSYPRRPLSEIPRETVMTVIDKVNALYDKHIEGNITTVPEQSIHPIILKEFEEQHRTESSRRHLRQASSLLRLAEAEGLVQDGTCYVELGAGRGQLAAYMCGAWCGAGAGAGEGAGAGSRALLLDRAAPRHRRDVRAARAGAARRVRADLAHVLLARAPLVPDARALLAFAKHLCGVATDYALRCLTQQAAGEGPAGGEGARVAGALLATCCHHRCQRAAYVGNTHLQELGINGEDINTILGIVSWATCGDGRSREKRHQDQNNQHDQNDNQGRCPDNRIQSSSLLEQSKLSSEEQIGHLPHSQNQDKCLSSSEIENNFITGSKDQNDKSGSKDQLPREVREQIGRKAKALLDWGRVLYLREKGFDARLCYYVPTKVSLENMCIVAKKKL